MNNKWIALYVNCTRGQFIPYGPFDSEKGAADFCNVKNADMAFPLWEVIQMKDPNEEKA